MIPRRRVLTVLCGLVALAAVGCNGTGTAPSGGSTQSGSTPGGASGSSSASVATLMVEGSPVAESDSGPYQFVALAQLTNGTFSDVTTLATWSTSNSQVARFGAFAGRPVLYTYRAGTVTITATYAGKSGRISVTVF